MNKKNIYVVTITYFDRKDFSISTYVEGYSEDLDGARAILDRERIRKIEKGCLPDRFKQSSMKWVYKHKYGSIICEIHLVGV